MVQRVGAGQFVVTVGLDRNANGALDVNEVQRTVNVFVVPDVELRIEVQAFIKQEWVDAPNLPGHGGNIFEGDNRITAGGLVDFRPGLSHRVQQKLTLVPYAVYDADGMKDGSETKDAGQSIEYDKASSLDGAGHITEFARADTVLHDGFRKIDEGFADMSRTTAQVTRLGLAKVQVSFRGAANNPLIASPDINYDFILVLDYTDPEHPTYRLTGGHDLFPCYQLFLNNHAANYYDSGDHTPLDLGTPEDPINVDRTEQISPDW